MADSLSFLLEVRGARDPLVQKVLAGRSPGVRASELIRTTKLGDVEFRRLAVESHAQDPMLEVAAEVDDAARKWLENYETNVAGPLEDAYGRLAKLEYDLGVTSGYPDATFSLRLAYGPVAGYELDGKTIPPFTKMSGLYKKGETFEQAAPYNVPKRWLERKDDLNLQTPFNFVSTPDITGGNSGSPVVNRDGQLVGLIFDGNTILGLGLSIRRCCL